MLFGKSDFVANVSARFATSQFDIEFNKFV